MNIPTKLTVSRIISVPLIMFFLLSASIPHRFLWALLIFWIASYTDYLDGKLARNTGTVTILGKFLDPVADKILILSTLVCFVHLKLAAPVVVILIICREFAVMALRLVAAERNSIIDVNIWGKLKTVVQIIAVSSILLVETMREYPILTGIIPAPENYIFTGLYNIMLWIAAVVSVISGIIYLRGNMNIIK